MEELLFAGKDAADAIGLEFGIGCRHLSLGESGRDILRDGMSMSNYSAATHR
jgi:hypothetical protein